jgi:predicted ATP-grasp superfamily ATP-dependent carboligase
MNALITDANKRTSIYALRSLGRRGIEVSATESKDIPRPIGFFSKYCKEAIRVPLPSSEQYIQIMLKLSKKYDVLIPISTDSMEPISKYLPKFERNTNVPIPDYEALLKTIDKQVTLEVASEQGIPFPKTFSPKNIEELKDASERITYPAVIKPRRGSGAQGVVYVNSASNLISIYELMHKLQEYPLIQEYIPGPGYGAFALFNKDSEPRAVFAHRRIREYPITGGQSTFCEGVNNPKIIKYGLKLLKALGWYGLAMVEFKLDKRDNEYKLMEINPRFWGSMPLAIASGVDFPYLLYKLAIDGDVNPMMSYRSGVKMRFLFADLLSCASYFYKQPEMVRVLCEAIQPFFDKSVSYGLLSLDDPKPALLHLFSRLSRINKYSDV